MGGPAIDGRLVDLVDDTAATAPSGGSAAGKVDPSVDEREPRYAVNAWPKPQLRVAGSTVPQQLTGDRSSLRLVSSRTYDRYGRMSTSPPKNTIMWRCRDSHVDLGKVDLRHGVGDRASRRRLAGLSRSCHQELQVSRNR